MKKRKLAIVSVVILFCLLFLELTTYLALSVIEKNWSFPATQRLLVLESNQFIVDRSSAECNYNDALYPHPYLAHVHHDLPPCGLSSLNRAGQEGGEIPVGGDRNAFTILLTGGSVANQMAAGPNFLEDELNRKYRAPSGSMFRVVSAADGAWKQPQEAISTLLFLPDVDGVVSVEGFNEHYMLRSHQVFELPSQNFTVVSPTVYGDLLTLAKVDVLSHVVAFLRSTQPFRSSYLCYLGAKAFSRWSSKLLDNGSDRQRVLSRLFAFPDEWSLKMRSDHNLKRYLYYLESMAALASYHRKQIAIFLQPIPHAKTFLTEEERSKIGDQSYVPTYMRMHDTALGLRKRGVPIETLLKVFADQKETIFSDWIHCRWTRDDPVHKNLGYEIMAKAIAVRLAALWKFQKKTGP